MAIIGVIIVTIILVATQANPVSIVRDNFFIGKSQARVLGASEENEINKITEGVIITSNSKVEDEAFLSTGLPEAGFRDARPIKKFNTTEDPEITARSAIVVDVKTKKILFNKDIEEVSSIASITKLMTALIVLEQNPDFTKKYTITKDDRREGGRIFLFQGDVVTIEDLFNISLVGSANTATIALVHSLDMTERDFVNNTSTAFEVAKILETALAKEKIRYTVLKKSYALKTGQGKQRIVESTDDLLSEKNEYSILGGKTGYLGSAGFCFTGKFAYNNHEIITVVLGSNGVNLRFSDTNKLVSWVYDNYIWP